MRSACPHCQTVNVFPPEASGTMVLCPQCKKSFFADPIPEDEAEGYRACPFCHERIRAGAKKCRWCQSSLDDTAPQQDMPANESVIPVPSEPKSSDSPSGNQNEEKQPSQETKTDQEEVIFNVHPTWKRLLPPMLVATLIILLSIPFLRQLENAMYFILLALFACVFWFLKRFVNIITTHYELTSKRLRVRTGFFTREEVEIRMDDIRAVWLRQNIIEQCLNFGDVLIGTSATAGAEISIADIDNPREVLDIMHELTKV